MGTEDLSKGINVDQAFDGTAPNKTAETTALAKILIADDQDMIRTALRRQLQSIGVPEDRIIEAKDAFELLTQKWFDHKKETAIIISDEQMPPSNLKGSDVLSMISGECEREGITPPLMFSHSTLVNRKPEFDEKINNIGAIPVEKGQIIQHATLITEKLGLTHSDNDLTQTPEHE